MKKANAQIPEEGAAEQTQWLIKDYILGTEGKRDTERGERACDRINELMDIDVMVGGSGRAVHYGLTTPRPAQSVTQQF